MTAPLPDGYVARADEAERRLAEGWTQRRGPDGLWTEWRKPRTPLGHKLVALRRKIIESGAPLLGWDDLGEEEGMA